MFANGFRRIFHQHLQKCGGTSVNAWLENQVADERLLTSRWSEDVARWFFDERADEAGNPVAAAQFKARSAAAFYCADWLHSHYPMRSFAPEGTFCFTMLRNPADRIASRVAHWRRLDPNAQTHRPRAIQLAVRDAQALPLRDFLQQYGQSVLAMSLDNYMVRCLAAGRIGLDAYSANCSDTLLEAATRSLQQDYHVVGLMERHRETRTAIAAALGLLHDDELEALNVAGSRDEMAAEIWAARDQLAELTQFDDILYDRAARLFEDRHASTATGDDIGTFSVKFAAAAVQRLKPTECDGDAVFSCKMPLIGLGLSRRRDAGCPHCCVWTAPGRRLVLLMPAPVGQRLTIKLWVRAFSNEHAKSNLRVLIDDHVTPHRFEQRAGYADLIAADAKSAKPFITLTVECVDHSARASWSLCFDRYGWRAS